MTATVTSPATVTSAATSLGDESVPFLDLRAATVELRAELDGAISGVLDSSWFVRGRALDRFEHEWAAYVGAGSAVGVGNGLDAITLVLRALGVGPGDEVIVPAQTFVATWLAVTSCGATPVPVEVVDSTASMDPAAALAAIGERTAAILPVHLFGIPAETGSLSVMARQHGVALVEDAAQAHGARSHGRRVGSGDSIATWSFYPGKNLGALGDGGAVTTSDRELAGRVARLGNYGSSAKYVHEELGCNSRLDDIQAAALSVRLAHLDDWNRRRAVVAAAYLEGLCDLDWLRLPKSPDWADPAWHLYVVRCVSRDRLRAHLASAGVECLVHYPTPPHLQSAYASLGFGVGAFPVAERFARESLSLPMGPHLRASQVDRVIDAIRSFRP